LFVKKQPPAHVFPDEWFEVEVALGVTEQIATSLDNKYDVEVMGTLHDSETEEQLQNDTVALTIDPSTIHLSTDSEQSPFQKVRCKISSYDGTSTTAEKPAPSVFIRFTTGIIWSPNIPESVIRPIQVNTTRLTVVAYKLKIRSDDEWEETWYKDEGGREKCMIANVGLFDKDQKREKGKKIPIALSLFYDGINGPIKVKNQKALRALETSKKYIDKKTGTAEVRFRIDEVSKNHQGQEFMIQIGADTDKYKLNNVAPVYTPQVMVKSKRYKRPVTSPTPGTGANTPAGPNIPVPLMPAPIIEQPWVPMNPPNAGQSEHLQHQQQLGHGSIPVATVPQQVSPPQHPSIEIHRLQQALNRVRSWTDEVVNALRPIKWQVVGYPRNSDGTSDFSHPYYNMNNPNTTIARLLELHAESVRSDLRRLEAAVTNTENESAAAAVASLQQRPPPPQPPYYPGYG